jgi:hypothetical protein
MEDILIVEKDNGVYRIRSKRARFSPQICATQDLLFGSLVSKGMVREEFIMVLAQVEKTHQTEIEVSLSIPLNQL